MTCYRSNNSPDDLRHAFARNDLLFTMSDNTHTRAIQPFGLRGIRVSGFVFLTDESLAGRLAAFAKATAGSLRAPIGLPAEAAKQQRLVEPDGIEPTTSCLQSRRSPS
jgi:hypothetical protein